MSNTLPSYSYNTALEAGPLQIRCRRPCHYCGEAVGSYRPVVIFGLERPEVVGAAHTECAYFDFRYAQFSLMTSRLLTRSESSILAHFYPRLFRLPGEGHPQAALRRCLASLLLDYPGGLAKWPALFSQFVEENHAELLVYPGDLEIDCYFFLGQVWQASQSEPLDVEIDFTRD